MTSYIFGGNTGISYADLQRRRQMLEAERLRQSGRAPQDIGEGLHALGSGLAYGLRSRALANREKERAARAGEVMSGILNPQAGPTEGQIGFGVLANSGQAAQPATKEQWVAAMTDPSLSPQQQSALGMLFQQQFRQTEPKVINGKLVDPTTGKVLGDYSDAPEWERRGFPSWQAMKEFEARVGRQPRESWQLMTPQEVAAAGLPLGGYKRNSRGDIQQIAAHVREPQGTETERAWQVLREGDPNSREYASAWAIISKPSTYVDQKSGQVVTTRNDPGQYGFTPPTVMRGSTPQSGAEQAKGGAGDGAVTTTPIPKPEGVRQAEANEARTLLSRIDALKNDENAKRLFGEWSLLPNYPGGGAADAQARIDQLLGQSFMQAYETLKGGGVITEIEGAKATAAITRMEAIVKNRGSYGAFIEALDEFRSTVENAMKREGLLDPSSGNDNDPAGIR